jgi:hypothetical protein
MRRAQSSNSSIGSGDSLSDQGEDDMPTKRDNDEERDRRIDQQLREQQKADALKEQSEGVSEGVARRAKRQAKATLERAEPSVQERTKRSG